MRDKTIKCCDCGKDFVFTTGEQTFYREKGFTNEPKRCPTCRMNRKNADGARDGQRGVGERQMWAALCDGCDKPCEVPFKPSGAKPVYCSNCFHQRKGAVGASDTRSSAAGR